MKGRNTGITFLGPELWFPPAHYASADGLLAAGGDLSPARLLLAYKSGIFPWFNDDSLILWWSPDPRMVLFPNKIRISKSMRRLLKSDRFRLTKNAEFKTVITNCADAKRPNQQGTWITDQMIEAYLQLHRSGQAVSYEVWEGEQLVGGLYGIDLGRIFCGESMFSRVSNASKFAFIRMVQEMAAKDYALIDCQMYTPHLASMGAETIPRKQFLQILAENIESGSVQ